MNQISRPLALLLCVFTVLIGSSAYIVYHNVLRDFPEGAGFFWLVFFGMVSTSFLPRSTNHPFYPELSGFALTRVVQQTGYKKLALDALFYTLSFACSLYVIKSKEPGVVITLMIVSQIRPAANAYLSFVVLGDKCNNWAAYIVGALMTAIGVILYRHQSLFADGSFVGLDLVVLVALMGSALNVCQGLLDAKIRRGNVKLTQHDVVTSMMAVASLFGIVWMFLGAYPSLPPLPTLNQFAALIYIGLIPTGLGMLLKNTTRDILGMHTNDAIGSTQPIFALIISTIPLAWFAQEHPQFTWIQWLGIIMTVVGAMIVARFAKGEAAINRQK